MGKPGDHVDGIFKIQALTKVHNILLVANPRSGSQNAAKFIEKYGSGVLHDMTVPDENVINEGVDKKYCSVTVFDLTT